MEDFKDGNRNDAMAARTSLGQTVLLAFVGTGGMTRLTTTPQRGIIGERFQTDHTWFGLSHQAKGSITCWASELMPGSSRDCNMAWGRWYFYRETKGHVRG